MKVRFKKEIIFPYKKKCHEALTSCLFAERDEVSSDQKPSVLNPDSLLWTHKKKILLHIAFFEPNTITTVTVISTSVYLRLQLRNCDENPSFPRLKSRKTKSHTRNKW